MSEQFALFGSDEPDTDSYYDGGNFPGEEDDSIDDDSIDEFADNLDDDEDH